MATITGISGNHRVESVATLPWNRWQPSRGIGGNLRLEYALEALTELGQAQIREISAIVDYQVAQIDLAFASGTLLGYARVDLSPLELPNPHVR